MDDPTPAAETGASQGIPGAFGGSRLAARPEVAAEVAALRAAVTGAKRCLVEIGFDHGRRLSATAAQHPDWTVVGLEVRERRVQQARDRAARDGLSNLHAFRLDGRAAVAQVLPPGSVHVLEALFPTPWDQTRAKSRKRNLITPAFLADAARALAPGGLLHLATDVAWVADQMALALTGEPALTLVDEPEGQALRPACRQQSRREWRCAQDGLPVFRFYAVRPAG